jgi:uncharacterized protein YdeI (YjbR/CyaY-like superfamily)
MVSRRKDAADPAKPIFFATPAAFRAWLEAHHAATQELWVGLHKRDSGMPSALATRKIRVPCHKLSPLVV